MNNLKETVESVAVGYAKVFEKKPSYMSVADANVLETLARASKGLRNDKQVILSRKTVKAFNKLALSLIKRATYSTSEDRRAAMRDLNSLSDIVARFNADSPARPI